MIDFSTKYLLPLVSYVFQDGPWRDTQVRLGYDPRQDPQARLYVGHSCTHQYPYVEYCSSPAISECTSETSTILSRGPLSLVVVRKQGQTLRTLVLMPTPRINGKFVHRSAKTSAGSLDLSSHIFDGKTMSKETAAYQLCDLEDSMLKDMVEDDEELRETCNVRFSLTFCS